MASTSSWSPPTLAPSLQAACDRWADRPAVTFRGVTITYAELARRVGSLAAAYRDLGVAPGDRIVCQLPNCPEHVVAMHAAWTCGAIHVGTDNDLTGPELASLVERTGAAALLFQPRGDRPEPFAAISQVLADFPATRVLVHADRGVPRGAIAFATLTGTASPPPATPTLGDHDTALLLLTSGTTGKSKAVMESLPHDWAKMQFFADAFGPGPDDVHLVFLPIGHVFGLRLATLPLLTGGRLVLLDRFTPDEALRLVTEEAVTVLPAMPAHLKLLFDRLDPARHDLSQLRWVISAAAHLPRPLAEQVYRCTGAEVLFVYGCSEGFTTLTTDREEILSGSVGATIFEGPPGTAPAGTVAILDPADHQPVAIGATGEIAFGATQPVRYWDDPEVASDGWYLTGDLGRLDAAGRVYIVGRLKELINRGGLKVAPGEVETALSRHPGVTDAAVVGTPDPVLGEAICACIVTTPTDAPSLAEIRAYLGESLARHKLPDELCLVDHVPRTNIGKVDRPALSDLIVSQDLPRERLRAR